ncbi:OprD family outer membrane porin [Candidatus Sororendozoicomonas aggregata]|uniref:OprD family outer membrane porin n=1 Tax=Candidatus Sororendozoicomonas aggregata TaxID=3073239 RepID=UPI002ED22B3F
MKLFKLSVLGAAVLAASAAQANFLEDSSFDIKLRNVVFDYDGVSDDSDFRQWAQGIEANFKSGYIGDVIGFDASYYGALKLDHAGDNVYDDLLGGSQGDKSYGKIGQAYLKAKLGDDTLNFYGQAGLMGLDAGLMASSGSRATPSSFRGFYGEVNIHDVKVFSSYVDQISLRTSTGYDDFTNEAGKKIDNAYQFGGTYNGNNISAEVVYLESQDYQQQNLVSLGYKLPINEGMALSFGGIYHEAKENGKLWDGAFDDKAEHYNLNTTFSVHALDVTLSYAKTNADKANGLGQFQYSFADNEYGSTPSKVSRQLSDFMYNGESAWQLAAGYRFDRLGAAGLKTTLTYTKGTGIEDNSSGIRTKVMDNEHETDLEVSYAFQQPELEGLSVKLQHAWHTAQYSSNHEDEKQKDLRFYVDYTVSVF